VKKVIIELN